MESDDEIPQLSAGALDALKEFYGDRDTKQKEFEDLKAQAENDFDGGKKLSMEAFTEDWNASQFWYNDETATLLAEQLLDGATDESSIVVVSAPSVFIQLKNLLASGKHTCRPQMTLLEFDERFAVFKEFAMYDFEHPMRLPAELKGKFDRIVCDPPFLSEDCQTKAKSWTTAPAENDPLRLIVCTGERMESLIGKLYSKAGIQTTSFEVKHAKGLSNEFRCYSNFECSAWEWAAKA
ncbi:N-6 adenine-specific DNA methyltransferas-like protein 2 [Lophium mytilinum]|uniref:Protein-lysine N-methyltransferase EFM5 n=1 Tax=Lophium mytilinum TaxID=390894 RepID=A0A6A6R964_9PEZI|nr:N-6 adenine-specific DNA methyltransferas-like protein 2 [Lophium mytilinum]